MAVDYGTKRIGLAAGEETGLGIHGIRTLSSEGLKRDAHRLIEWAESLGAERIILGQPLTMSGAVGEAARRVQKLAAQIERLTDLPVTLWDERLTSNAADQWMAEQEIKPRRRRAIRDQVAACLILEDYLSQVHDHEGATGSSPQADKKL